MTNKCPAVGIYKSLEFCTGDTSLPGLRPEAFYIPKSLIVTFPTRISPKDEGATMESIGTLKGDFTLAADAYFRKIDILDTASNLTAASQGDPPSRTFLNSTTLKYAGNDAKAAGFCQMANTDDILYVVRQRDGSYRVVGNEEFRSDTKPGQDSGMNVTDASGTTLEVSVTDRGPAPFYVGKLKTEEGTIDCATGKIELTEGA